MNSPIEEVSRQWGNPTDILTLLLLIGGNIVQMAIAQLSGYKIRIPGKGNLHLSIAPVAFSFGWSPTASQIFCQPLERTT